MTPAPEAHHWTTGDRAIWFDPDWNNHADDRIDQTVFDGVIDSIHESGGVTWARFGSETPRHGQRPQDAGSLRWLCVQVSSLWSPAHPDAPYGEVGADAGVPVILADSPDTGRRVLEFALSRES